MIDAEKAARLLHSELVRTMAKAQKRVVLHEALLQRFGNDVVPQESMLQTKSALKNGGDQLRRWIASDLERIAESTEAIRELETLFEQKDQADIMDLVAMLKKKHGLK